MVTLSSQKNLAYGCKLNFNFPSLTYNLQSKRSPQEHYPVIFFQGSLRELIPFQVTLHFPIKREFKAPFHNTVRLDLPESVYPYPKELKETYGKIKLLMK